MMKSGGLRRVSRGGGIWILTLIFSVCASLPLLPALLLAQERPQDQTPQERGAAVFARVQALMARHTVTVHGVENPNGIPRGQLLRLFFSRLSLQAPSDDVSFAQFALDSFGATGSDTDLLSAVAHNTGVEKARVKSDICERVLDGSLPDGLSIAKYVTAADEKEVRDDETYYQAILDKLSPTVRDTVIRRAVVEGVAKVDSTTLDHMGMASEDPDLYKVAMTGICRGKKSAVSSTANVLEQPHGAAEIQR